jgi:hypothetical protein
MIADFRSRLDARKSRGRKDVTDGRKWYAEVDL